MRAEVFVGLAAVPDRVWAHTAREDFYGQRPWVEYQGAADGVSAFFVAVTDDDGLVRAAAPAYLVEHETNVAYLPPLDTERDGRSAPLLLVGGRRGHRAALGLDAADPSVGDVVATFVDGLIALRAETGAAAVWCPYLDSRTAEALATDSRVSGPHLQAGDATIALAGDGFADYLDSLPKKDRTRVRADRRHFSGAARSVRADRLSEVVDLMAELLTDHQASHGTAVPVGSMRKLVQGQAGHCDDASRVFSSWSGSVAVAGTLTFSSDDLVSSRAYGIHAGVDRGACDYFELTYYLPAELAYARGARALHLGIGTLRTKTRRGADVGFRWACAVGAGVTEGLRRSRNEKVLDAVLEDLGGTAAPLDEDSRAAAARQGLEVEHD